MAIHHHNSHEMVKIEKESNHNSDIEAEEVRPHFPWGMTLHMENELIDTLDLGGLKARDTLEIKAIAFVENTSDNTDAGGEVNKSITLQLVEIGVGPTDEDVAGRLYPGDSG